MTAAAYKQAQASLDRSKLDLTRTRIYSPVDAYFEETLVGKVAIGDGASAKLMAYPQTLSGHVAGVGRGISVPNSTTDASGLATVNLVFTWVRLAQRVPVRIELDTPIPALVHLTAGITATVSINR